MSSPSEIFRAFAAMPSQPPISRVRAALSLGDEQVTQNVMQGVVPLGEGWRQMCRNYLIGLDPDRVTPCTLADAFDAAWDDFIARQEQAVAASNQAATDKSTQDQNRFRSRKRTP